MKIERRSFMQTSWGIFASTLAQASGVWAAYVVDDHITVLERTDGSFGFKDHKTGKEPSKAVQQKIIKAIKEVK